MKLKVEILSYLTATYETLMHKQFKYMFEGNVVLSFQFKASNFYHLLGFHKMYDSTVAQMLRNNDLDRETFFAHIKSGKIGLDYIDDSITENLSEDIVNFSETEYADNLKNVKERRFAYFNELSLTPLLLSDIVIDFDPKSCGSEIEAEKLFFKMIENRNRNLNLFIGRDEEEHYFYPSTFFLEITKDKYKHSKEGVAFPQFKLLSREIIDTNSNQSLHFYVNWWRVFFDIATQTELETLNSMKAIQGQYTSATHAKELLNKFQDTLDNYIQRKKELDNYVPQSQKDAKSVKNETKDIAKKVKKVKKKIETLTQYLSIVHELEVKSLLKIYQEHCSVTLNKQQLEVLIQQHDFFHNTLMPNQFLEIYKKQLF